MILVSMCICGVRCNYRGRKYTVEEVMDLVEEGKAVPICPEQLGGLPTPRDGARIQSGSGEDVLDGKTRVITDRGEDVTENYIRGAEKALKVAELVNADKAILKQSSPSCGKGRTQGGEKERKTTSGNGVTTALFQRNGIEVLSNTEL